MSTIPSVAELPAPENHDGLLLEGYAATWDLDRAGDAFDQYSLDRAVQKFMATNPVLLFSHNYGLPPVGRIVHAEIQRDKGLFVKALLPKPATGTFGYEIWDAAKNGILRALSVGGKWFRQDKGTHSVVFDADLTEISLCPVAVNGEAFASAIVPTEVKCLSNGSYLATEDYAAGLVVARRELALADCRLTIAENFQRARS